MKRQKSELSVFGKPYNNYTRWWQIHRKIRNFMYSLRRAWQRATRGFCSMDWIMFDWYLAALLRDIFEDFAEHHHGYAYGFTSDEWSDFLREISKYAGEYAKDVDDFPVCVGAIRRVDKALYKCGDKPRGKEWEEANDYWHKCQMEVKAAQMQSMRKALEIIKEKYGILWD